MSDITSSTSIKAIQPDSAVVGRFAPTPSGRMHLGNVFSLLLAWLSAKSQNGSIVLRIEDLDPRAQHSNYSDALMHDLEWLGLFWDKGPYYQSNRKELYREALYSIAKQGLSYPCFCTRAELHAAQAPHASDGSYLYSGRCKNLSPKEIQQRALIRPGATRIKVPAKDSESSVYTICDRTYGTIQENLALSCGDFIIRRSDGVFAYQLAVVVDDATMGITEVVRGRDLLESSLRQAYLYDCLGYRCPNFAHVPLLMSPSGRRLSKRDHDLDLGYLREQGIRPQAIIGRLAHILNLAQEKEELSPNALLSRFSWDAVRKHSDNFMMNTHLSF